MKQVWLITGNIGSIEDTELSDFHAQIETNLFGVINVTKAAIPVLREQGSGHIIQLSSVGGRVGAMGRAPYSAAKWGVEGFRIVEQADLARLEADRKWRHLSVSTDFDANT